MNFGAKRLLTAARIFATVCGTVPKKKRFEMRVEFDSEAEKQRVLNAAKAMKYAKFLRELVLEALDAREQKRKKIA